MLLNVLAGVSGAAVPSHDTATADSGRGLDQHLVLGIDTVLRGARKGG